MVVSMPENTAAQRSRPVYRTDFSSKDDVFGYLMHLGYLAYTRETKTCRIPNKEVREEWFRALKKTDLYAVTDRIISSSKKLLEETMEGNAEAVSAALIPFTRSRSAGTGRIPL